MPGSQKLTPPSSAREPVGTDVMPSPNVVTTATIRNDSRYPPVLDLEVCSSSLPPQAVLSPPRGISGLAISKVSQKVRIPLSLTRRATVRFNLWEFQATILAHVAIEQQLLHGLDLAERSFYRPRASLRFYTAKTQRRHHSTSLTLSDGALAPRTSLARQHAV